MIELRTWFYLFCLYGISYCFGVWGVAALLSFHLIWAPAMFKYSSTFRRCLIFGNCFQWPFKIDFENPTTLGIEGARNVTIQFKSVVNKCNITIGTWHILPISACEKLKNFSAKFDTTEMDEIMNKELSSSKKPIVFYCHGKMSSRAATHRIHLYKILQRMDCHVITFDYRGFGDSSNVNPSKDGVVEDSLMAYAWLQNLLHRNGIKPQVYVWGHSLGAGIASHLVGDLDTLSENILEKNSLPYPDGLILEAPFNNIVDEIIDHSVSKLVNFLPHYDDMFVGPFRQDANFLFQPDKLLAKKCCQTIPVLILHARDDILVPYVLGEKLYHHLVQARKGSGAAVFFQAFDESEAFGNKWICKSTRLPRIIGDFMGRCQESG